MAFSYKDEFWKLVTAIVEHCGADMRDYVDGTSAADLSDLLETHNHEFQKVDEKAQAMEKVIDIVRQWAADADPTGKGIVTKLEFAIAAFDKAHPPVVRAPSPPATIQVRKLDDGSGTYLAEVGDVSCTGCSEGDAVLNLLAHHDNPLGVRVGVISTQAAA